MKNIKIELAVEKNTAETLKYVAELKNVTVSELCVKYINDGIKDGAKDIQLALAKGVIKDYEAFQEAQQRRQVLKDLDTQWRERIKTSAAAYKKDKNKQKELD